MWHVKTRHLGLKDMFIEDSTWFVHTIEYMYFSLFSCYICIPYNLLQTLVCQLYANPQSVSVFNVLAGRLSQSEILYCMFSVLVLLQVLLSTCSLISVPLTCTCTKPCHCIKEEWHFPSLTINIVIANLPYKPCMLVLRESVKVFHVTLSPFELGYRLETDFTSTQTCGITRLLCHFSARGLDSKVTQTLLVLHLNLSQEGSYAHFTGEKIVHIVTTQIRAITLKYDKTRLHR